MQDSNAHPGMFWLFFSPSGRLSPWPYFLSLLFWLVLPCIAISQMYEHMGGDTALALWTFAFLFIAIAGFVSFIMLSIKRVHDLGYPAPLVILLFVPVASFFVLVWLVFWPSSGPNAFGERPNAPR